ncbi:MAG: hypothetical protein EHM47_10490 [Ignavibacteriales bacterium]|nr:MAG: hypothetical protein EHM47_10490 [Ignavibacteriales bacterium]
MDGILFRLYDTAGIRLTEDEIEKEGVLRSRNVIKNADIIILIKDIFENGSEELFDEIKGFTSPEKIIRVTNKIDLERNLIEKSDVLISALTGEGIENLFNKLKQITFGNSQYTEQSAIVSNIRHYECLKKARENLQKSLISINNKFSGEFIASDIRNAVFNLGDIIGEVTSEDILNNIFAKFCIGK